METSPPDRNRSNGIQKKKKIYLLHLDGAENTGKLMQSYNEIDYDDDLSIKSDDQCGFYKVKLIFSI